MTRLQELTTRLEEDLAAAASGSGGATGRSGSGAGDAGDVLAAAASAPIQLLHAVVHMQALPVKWMSSIQQADRKAPCSPVVLVPLQLLVSCIHGHHAWQDNA